MIDLYEVIEQALKGIKAGASLKNILISNTVERGSYVSTDVDYSHIILRNILQNAIKFTENGGMISVSYHRNDKEHVIRITDAGIGMSLEQLSKLLDFKGEATYGTNDEKGVGLALIVARDLLKAQNGKISLKSELEQGSTVCISFTYIIGWLWLCKIKRSLN